MAIFLNENSKVIVQGMTGSEGMKHTTRMLASGTKIVGGVNPRKAGTSVDFPGDVSVPVFGSVKEAMDATGADVSVVFVPPAFAKDAVIEAIAADPRAVLHAALEQPGSPALGSDAGGAARSSWGVTVTRNSSSMSNRSALPRSLRR